MKASQMTDSNLKAELARAELECQMIVSSVHGVIHSGLANRLTELRGETTRRILEAIEECDRFIAKEEPRRADLRPADMAQHLEFCKTHKAKLEAMLK